MAHKKEKLESRIRKVLGELLISDIKDPRIGFVTISKVSVNRDFSEAFVGISILGTPREMRKSLEGLRSSTGYLQHRLNKALEMRHAPAISFHLDPSISQGSDMISLIDELNAGTEGEPTSSDE